MGKEIIHTDDAAPAAGAYSQATTDGDLVFTAGQIALTPEGEPLDAEPAEVVDTTHGEARAAAAEIADRAGVDPDSVLLDVPPRPQFTESRSRVVVDGAVRRLSDASELVGALRDVEPAQWRLGVYAPTDAVDAETVEKRTEIFNDTIENAVESYQELLELGMPPEDARFVLPIGTKVNMVMSMNARMLMHVADMRAAADAQWEIRGLTEDLLDIAADWCPITFDYYEREMKNRKNRLAP